VAAAGFADKAHIFNPFDASFHKVFLEKSATMANYISARPAAAALGSPAFGLTGSSFLP